MTKAPPIPTAVVCFIVAPLLRIIPRPSMAWWCALLIELGVM